MATGSALVSKARSYHGIPPQGTNQQDALGDVSRESLARRVSEFHTKGLSDRRHRDLTAEKYFLHTDGEGDAQYADLYHGERISIPMSILGTPRTQENLLRPIIGNAVAYHTTMPFRFIAEAKQDRQSRQSALIDQAFANYLAQRQRLNAVFAEAFFLACVYGHCPVHAFWRNDVTSDLYEPAYVPEESRQDLYRPQRGFIDCWVGDPWDTVYHSGATRNSVQMYTYGRILPADQVRNAFGHVPGAEHLSGSEKMPSASLFQRIGRRWAFTGQEVHGTAVVHSGENSEELLALVCREIAPGIDSQWPQGRLTIAALDGAASTDRQDQTGGRGGRTSGHPVLLHDGPLPGQTFSSVRIYSQEGRGDDVLGKPFVADLDDLQIRLNQALGERKEIIRRISHQPLATTGAMDMDTATYDRDPILEVEPNMTGQNFPRYLEYPIRQYQVINDEIEECRQAMYTLGGYQAASRGEAHAGDSGKKVLALARADDTIHGPVNQRFREAVEDFMGICWRLMKQYGDVPWVVDITGDELAHIAEPYIDRTRLSDEPPSFKLVSGFGATPESRAQQLLNLVQSQGADGEPLMSTRQFKRAWPDESLYGEEEDPEEVRKHRAKVINERIRQVADDVAAQFGQRAPMFAQMAHERLMQLFPPLPDDPPQMHIIELGNISQDETEHPLARQLARMRQGIYFQIVQQAQQRAVARAEAEDGGTNRNAARAERARAANEGGTTTSDSLQVAAARGDQAAMTPQ